jgi:hypothetical protein
MKIKVSKVFADFINKTAKELGFKAEAKVVTMSERGYCLNVGLDAAQDAENYGDYDWRKDEYKAIRVCYPYEYYAMPRYLTTAALVREFRRSSVQTIEELKTMLRDMCEI